jgi:hypothetical protein
VGSKTERLGAVKNFPDEFPRLDDDRSHPKRGDEGLPIPKKPTHLSQETPLTAFSTALLLDVGVL